MTDAALVAEVRRITQEISGLEERLAFLRDQRRAALQAAYDSGATGGTLMRAAGFTSIAAVRRLITARRPRQPRSRRH